MPKVNSIILLNPNKTRRKPWYTMKIDFSTKKTARSLR